MGSGSPPQTLRRLLFKGGVLLTVVGAAGWITLDRLVGTAVDRWRPDLERQLAKPLGHPLRLGPYQGLRPWGIALGPTQVLPGPRDDSTLSIASAAIGLDPLASLWRWKPVAVIRLNGVRLVLRRNQNGAYWVPGPAGTDPPPKLDLDLRLQQPAQIAIATANLNLSVAGRTTLQLDQSKARAQLQVVLPEQGRVGLQANADWRRSELDLRARIQSLNLTALEGLLPQDQPLALQGQIGGDVKLAWRDGRARCQGGLSLANAVVASQGWPDPLRSPQLQISCRGDRLQVPRSAWTFGPYRAGLQGDVALNRAFNLQVDVEQPGVERQLRASLRGPWKQPRLHLAGRWRLPDALPVSDPVALQLRLSADWRDPNAIRANLDQLKLQAPGLVVQAQGRLYPTLAVRTDQLALGGAGLAGLPLLPELLGQRAPVQGSLQLQGATRSPEISLSLAQPNNPLLQDWSLRAGWTAAEGMLRLEELRSPVLQARAQLPVAWTQGAAAIGDLRAALQLKQFPLARLGPLVGTTMDGHFSASGELNGPLTALRPELDLRLVNPQAGMLRLAETWHGSFTGRPGGGGQLRMASSNWSLGGVFDARLAPNWFPSNVKLTRQHGELTLTGSPVAYRWQASKLPLTGLELALPPKGRFEGLFGLLSGEGTLGLQPLAMAGTLSLERPGLLGVQLQQARFEGSYSNRRYQVSGELLPPTAGQMLLTADGHLGAGLKAELEARGLSARWLTRGVLSFTDLAKELPGIDGVATDLGTLLVNTFGGSLEGQLKALQLAHKDLQTQDQNARDNAAFHPEDLRGQVDAQISLEGDRLAALNLALEASGHLWVEGDDVDHALQIKPFVATVRGPLQAGEGTFSLKHLPFSLLALVAPVPPSLLGAVGLTGSYRLGQKEPALTTELVLEDARIGSHRLMLEKGQISLSGRALLLDLALKEEGAHNAVVMTGRVPLEATGTLDVRVLTEGDGLRFLTGLADDRVAWSQGNGSLILILSGTPETPQANGFFVVENGRFEIEKQVISNLQTSIFFDFNRLEVESLVAKVGKDGKDGRIEAQGGLALFKPLLEEKPLTVAIRKSRLNLPIASVQVDGDLTVTGALVQPQLAGAVAIGHGAIKPTPALFARPTDKTEDNLPVVQPVAVNTLLEEKWDFQQPLVLLGSDVEANTSRSIKAAMPKLPALRFNDLQVDFGPKLAVTMAPLASFTTQGRLFLNGALDPSFTVRGLLEMLTGRISVFTTSFQLDRRASNVAVFTPRMGLIPYVDVALTTRVSDSVSLGVGNNAVSTNVFDTNGTGALGGGGQLRLVKVMVEASGPADRLVNNLTLRSSPPMPRAQLLSLIGGNSLAGLSNAGGGAAVAAVLGQSLLSPVIGTLSDAFSQRLQFALFPTYVTPEVQDQQERVSGQVPPQLAVVTELGVDLTDRFNLSVLAAPNRNDVPPQGTLTYSINPNLDLMGSVDAQGTWQSQFQVFFRF